MDEGNSPAFEARTVLRAARQGTLATSAAGHPFASLVTPATATDGTVLMLLSDLSEHTRHLRADPRCALLVAGAATSANPQTAPRLSLSGTAVLEPDPALKDRWVASHPYAAFYAGFGDFNLWRLTPEAGSFVGGFARAHRLPWATLAPDPAAVATVGAAEAGVLAHCNADHADALDLIAGAHGLDGACWRMAACDVDGFDLVRGEIVRRIAWAAPVDGPGAIRAALVAFAGAARNSTITSAGRPGTGPV